MCGTDVHIERWDDWAAQNFGPPPMTFGHEMAGVVVARGPGATRIAVGETVAAETHFVDWTCYQCRTGRAFVCQNMRILGVHVPGSFAEFVILPEVNAWVYEDLPFEVACLQEPLGNAVFSTFVEEVAGQTALVTGCGPIGLMSIAVLKKAGARAVYATDLNEERMEMARRMGADLVLDARDDVVARLRAETDGNGVDAVLEMSGSAAALHQGFAAVTNGGRVSLLGTHAVPATLDLSKEVIFKGLRIYGITGRRLWETWYRTTALLEEGLDLSRSSPTACRCPSTRRLSTSWPRATRARSCCSRSGAVEGAASEDDARRSAGLPGRRTGHPARAEPLPAAARDERPTAGAYGR
jgi:threonine 3-dehydrogenase